MKTAVSSLSCALLGLALAGASSAMAQQVPPPKTPIEVAQPSNDVIMQGIRRRDSPNRLHVGLADGEHVEPANCYYPSARTGQAERCSAGSAEGRGGHAQQLHRSGPDVRDLSEPGRGLRPWFLR